MGSKVPPKSAQSLAARCLLRSACLWRLRAGELQQLLRGVLGQLLGVIFEGQFVRVGQRFGRLQPIEGVRHRPHQRRHSFAAGCGDGVEFQAALRAIVAQVVEACAVGGGVELGAYDDHRAEQASAGLNAASSPLMISKSRTGSRSDASLVSTRCAISRVRSICRRNRVPKPAPSWAPSISPGRSATTNERPVARRPAGSSAENHAQDAARVWVKG